jgi:hypothetical protein
MFTVIEAFERSKATMAGLNISELLGIPEEPLFFGIPLGLLSPGRPFGYDTSFRTAPGLLGLLQREPHRSGYPTGWLGGFDLKFPSSYKLGKTT